LFIHLKEYLYPSNKNSTLQMNKALILSIVVVIATLSSCTSNEDNSNQDVASQLPIDSVKAIAKEAYIYLYPMMDAYRIEHAYFVDSTNPEYKTTWNKLRNISHVYTSEDKAVQTPNSDTPYSMAGLDLRVEPIVLTIPKIEKNRYFSVQLIDAYTANFDYIGSRTTGNDGGVYMIAGPGWKGETPSAVTKVFHSETELAIAIYRTQLFNPADIENVKKIQSGYLLQTLSAFLNKNETALTPIDFITPLTPAAQQVSLQSFNILNFLLQFCPTHPSETTLMERFSKIGIGAGFNIDTTKLSAEVKAAMKAGIEEAWTKNFAELQKRIESGEVRSGELFGTRDHLKNNYLYRMAAAKFGIFGNSQAEAMYPSYALDSDGEKLDATTNRYTIHFKADNLPPVNAFWSITMYELPASLLTANSLNRYLLNSTMLKDFKRDNEGDLTFYIQHDSPGRDKEPNWLPAPKGPFAAVLRLYWPSEKALDGTWVQPSMQKVK
jgi:hypothetical protein